MKFASTIGTLLLVCAVTLSSLLAGELLIRAIDGYALTSLELVSTRPAPPADPQSVDRATRYAKHVRLDPAFRFAWFDSNFKSIGSILRRPHQLDHPLPKDWVRAVDQTSDPLAKEELKYVYNDNLVKNACFTGKYPGLLNVFKKDPGFVYTFRAPDKTDDPAFRFVPHWNLGSYVPNNLGFRGVDLAYPKPPDTIRVAFLGQSNTQDGWPNFVGLYLNTWARAVGLHRRFQIINAGRAGVGIDGIARIMRYEVAPLRPDIIVVYVGATNLRAEDILSAPASSFQAPQRSGQSPYTALLAQADRYSALMNRVSQLASSDRDVGEPEKPPHKLRMDLSGPVKLDQPNLPFRLNEEIAELRYIERASRAIDAHLFLASSLVLAHEGLKLDLTTESHLYDQLRTEYWPMTYREIRLSADFENRAYRELSVEDHLGFLEIAKYFPQDPALFGDMVHLVDGGMNLQAWIVAQELAPFIQDKVEKGQLPTTSPTDAREMQWAREAPRKFVLSGCKK